MRHAFLMNVHKDYEQAAVTLELLRQWYPDSARLLYLDGPAYPLEAAAGLRKQVDFLEWRDWEADKPRSLVQSLNTLLQRAGERSVEFASFLHADMLPTDRDTFARFLGRFAASGKLLTYAPMWPGHRYLSFCDLHFNVPEVTQAGILPFACRAPGRDEDCNEAYVTYHLMERLPDWKDRAYHLWTIVRPYTGESNPSKHGHQAELRWVFHNYTPETSVIHTNDAEFYQHYERIAR